MEYSFKSGHYNEGNRIFIKVPFNVWELVVRKVIYLLKLLLRI